MRKTAIASALGALLASFAAQAATESFFLTIPGIPGDVLQVGFEGSISATSFSEGFTSTPVGNGGASCQEFRIIKPLDVTSPQIALAVATGQVFTSIQLAVISNSERPIQFLTFTLQNAVISSVRFGGDSDTSARVETIAMKPARVMIQYRPQAPDGSLGAPVQATVDCTTRH